MRIVVIPGMGCTPVHQVNWYGWFAQEMNKCPAVSEVILRDFPDPYHCKESVWIPFLENDIGLDENTIVVGHSSGASCAMRLLERSTKLKGVILVAAAWTDMGSKSEARSEYFNRPWDWNKMKTGAETIVLFHGVDDNNIPVEEARFIAKMMKGDNFTYMEMDDVSHFFYPWPEILHVMDEKFGISSPSTEEF